MLEAIKKGHKEIKKLCTFISKIQKEILEKLQQDYKYINLLDWKTCKDLIDNVNEK